MGLKWLRGWGVGGIVDRGREGDRQPHRNHPAIHAHCHSMAELRIFYIYSITTIKVAIAIT